MITGVKYTSLVFAYVVKAVPQVPRSINAPPHLIGYGVRCMGRYTVERSLISKVSIVLCITFLILLAVVAAGLTALI
jgi:hypothetical protein